MKKEMDNQKPKKKLRQFLGRNVVGKIFIDPEGNLRPVPVGIAAVFFLIVIASLVMQIKTPTEKVLVKVTHRFQAQPQPRREKKSPKPEARQEALRDILAKDKQLLASLNKAKQDISRMKKEAEQAKARAREELAAAQRLKEEAKKIKAQAQELLAIAQEKYKQEIAKKEEELNTIEMERQAQEERLREKEEKAQLAEQRWKKAEEENRLLKEQLEKLRVQEKASGLANDLQEKTKELREDVQDTQEKIKEVKEESQNLAVVATQEKKKAAEIKAHLIKITTQTPTVAGKKIMGGVKLSAALYKRLYRHRFQIAQKGSQKRYRWQVDNQAHLTLKDCYSLFDMKAVALSSGRYYDLTDLSLIPKEALDNYSSTVIVAENPRRDFGKEIKSLHLDPSEVIVRYYMYDHIRNYFYSRIEQAVNCSLRAGLIEERADLQERLEVVGNVFRIEKEGGGNFGVFLPTRIYYRPPDSDKMIEREVPRDCFAGEEDIEILRQNGLL